jgi:hypothetical protein
LTLQSLTLALRAKRNLRSMTKFLLVTLADQVLGDGCARTSVENLADATLQNADTVNRGLHELEDAGYIKVLARGRNGALTIRFEGAEF